MVSVYPRAADLGDLTSWAASCETAAGLCGVHGAHAYYDQRYLLCPVAREP